MACVAFYTCGKLRGGLGSEQVKGFFELAPLVFEAANPNSGCLGHMMDEERGWPPSAQDWGRWGSYAVPRFYRDVPAELEDRVSATISFWSDVDAVRRFAYGGAHGQALRSRKDWFESSAYPQYVMWWIEDGAVPTWGEGCARLEALHDNGPTTHAFNFRVLFPAS